MGENRGAWRRKQLDPNSNPAPSTLELGNMEETMTCLGASGSSTLKDFPQKAFVNDCP